MRNRFPALCGKLGEVLVLFGDWDTRNHHHLKVSPPTEGKDVRKLFGERGDDVRLINEAYASKRWSVCWCGETKTLTQRTDTRKGREKQERAVWRLVHCQNTECERMRNRNGNAIVNLLRAALAVLHGLPRLNYLLRLRGGDSKKKNSASASA